MINVFFDTNILFEDYFFEKYHNKKLLEYCRNGLINIYLSEIVRLELRKQFLDEPEEKNRNLKKVIKDLRRLKIDKEIVELDTIEHLHKFDAFYKKLNFLDNFDLLSYKNEYLPDVVDRAIYRKKPFTKEKMELKDAIIWKTYSEYVESTSVETSILLTENHSDFCDKNDHSKVHPELLKDTGKFKVIKNSFEFIKEYAATLESPQHRLEVFLQKIQIDDNYVDDLVHEHFNDALIEAIRNHVQELNPSDVLNDEYWHDGYVSDGEIELLKCEEVEHEQLTDTILMSAKIKAYCEAEVFEYNVGRDHGEDQYNSVGEKTITYEIHFSFNLSPEQRATDLEILTMEIEDTH